MSLEAENIDDDAFRQEEEGFSYASKDLAEKLQMDLETAKDRQKVPKARDKRKWKQQRRSRSITWAMSQFPLNTCIHPPRKVRTEDIVRITLNFAQLKCKHPALHTHSSPQLSACLM